MWWTKPFYRMAVSPLDAFSVLYSTATRHLTTTIPIDDSTTDYEDDDLDEISALKDSHKLDDALVKLEQKDRLLEDLKEQEAKRQEELEAKARELDSVTSRLEERLKEMELGIQEFGALTEDLHAQVRSSEKRLQDQVEQTKKSEMQLKKAQAVAEDRNRTIEALQKRLSSTMSLLDARTTEIQGMRDIFGPPDSISDVDAVKLVSALNAEIFQTASLLADSFGTIKSRALEGIDNRSACGRVRQMFGPRLVELLRSVPHDENPILLRVAFQACMVVFSDWISAAWHFQMEPAPQFFGEVYRNVWISEDQAISGRWRSLTRQHIQQLLNETPENIKSRFAIHIADSLADVLLCAGLHNKHSQVGEAVIALASEKIIKVVDIALRLNRMLGEDITSADIETTWVHSQEPFDSMWMEDDYGDWRGNGHGAVRVLCTTDLGLRRLVKAKNDNGWEDKVLLKPKVALEEVTDSPVSAQK